MFQDSWPQTHYWAPGDLMKERSEPQGPAFNLVPSTGWERRGEGKGKGVGGGGGGAASDCHPSPSIYHAAQYGDHYNLGRFAQ